MTKQPIYVLILCGGGGTRLWPRSRRKTPKQFINLLGEKTIFSQTIKRAKALTTDDKIFIITNADYVDEVYQQGQIPLRNIIAEPEKKDTALAMAAGAAVIQKQDPEAVIANFASDQLISPVNKFVADMKTAIEAAASGEYLVSVGIKPSVPHTGFGYIHASDKLMRVAGRQVFKVKEFKEKPDLATAKRFVKNGRYFWNANLYTWKASAFLAACEKYAPKVYQGAKQIQEAWGTKDEQVMLKKVYAEAEGISVDYAVSERVKNLVLLPATVEWSDVGDWRVVWETLKKNNHGNVAVKLGEKGELVAVDSENNLVQFQDQLVALVGVKDLVIINTQDALLICPREKAQDVKKVVKLLKARGQKEYL